MPRKVINSILDRQNSRFYSRSLNPPSRLLRLFSILFIFVFIFPSASFAAKPLEQRIKEYQLKNGMKIVVLPRHGIPAFSAYIRFLVGSVDEKNGYSGAAHILEHMLFKGSKEIGTKNFAEENKIMLQVEQAGRELDAELKKGRAGDKKLVNQLRSSMHRLLRLQRKYIVKDEISSIYQKAGGSGFNAFTSQDTTTYLLKLPSNKFELWAWIESDRLRNPILREYYPERDVVLEERRMRVDNSPEGTLYEKFLSTAFAKHPYKNPVIGWQQDISLLSKDYVKEFLKTYYSPNNMAIVIVGDLDPDYVYRTIKRYFGDIPSQKIPARVSAKEPQQKKERRVSIRFDSAPQIIIGWHKPSMPSRDDYLFDVLSSILTDGRTSRLYKKLVLQKRLAVSITGWMGPGSRYDNLYMLHAIPRAPHTVKEVERAIYKELRKLAKEPVSDWELQKVVNSMEVGFVKQLLSNSGLAHYISSYQILLGDWRYMTGYLDVIRSITPQELQETVKKYMTKQNRTVAILKRKGGAK